MKAIKFTLILLAVIAFFVIVSMAYLFMQLDENKDLLAGAASRAISRDVFIEQVVSLNWSMTPSVTVEGVRVANPQWLDENYFVRAERAELELDLSALLERRLVIRHVTLTNADILLQSTKDGKRNWHFVGEASGSSAWTVNKFKAEELRVHYRPAEGQAYDVAIAGLEILEVGSEQVSIDAHLVYDDLPVVLSMKSTQPLTSSQSMEFTAIKAKVGNHNFSGSMHIPLDSTGSVNVKLDMHDLDLSSVLQVGKGLDEDAEELLKRQWSLDFLPDLDVDLQLGIEKFRLDDVIYNHVSMDGHLADKNLKLAMSDREKKLAVNVNLKPQGRKWLLHLESKNKRKLEIGSLQVLLNNADILLQPVKGSKSRAGLDDKVTRYSGLVIDQLKTKNMQVYYKPVKGQAYDVTIAELQLLGAGSDQLSIDASLVYDDLPIALSMKSTHPQPSRQSMEFTAIKAKVGDHYFSGSMNIPMNSAAPVDLNLTMRELNLTPLVNNNKTAGKVDAELLKKQWPLDVLPDLNVDFKLGIDEVRVDEVIFKYINLKGSLAGRNLKLVILNRDGNLATNINLKPQGKQWRLHFINKSKLELGSLIKAEGLKASRSQAPMTLNVDLIGTGQSLSAMLTTARGRIDIVVGDGDLSERVSGYLPLGSVIFTVLDNIGTSKAAKQAKLECAVLHLDVTDGVGISNKQLALQTDKVNVLGSGSLKLDNGEMDLQFKIVQRQGVGLSVTEVASNYIRLTGTLANPKTDVNVAGVVTHGGAAWATGGLSLLLDGLASRLTVGGNPCEKVLQSLANKQN